MSYELYKTTEEKDKILNLKVGAFGGRTVEQMEEDEKKDLQGESAITVEHVENNTSVRDMLGQRGIKPEDLPASEDIKKLERRVKREEKKLAEQSGKLTNE